MKTEDLKAIGLSEEQIQEVHKLHGLDITAMKHEKSVLEADLENLNRQLTTANEKIESFGDIDVDEIKREVEEYKLKLEEVDAAHKKEMEGLKQNHSIDLALTNANARNVKAVKALLDMEKLQGSKDFSADLSRMIDGLKESDGYLFDTKEMGTKRGAVQPGNSIPKGDGEPMTYSQMMAYLDQHPGAKV